MGYAAAAAAIIAAIAGTIGTASSIQQGGIANRNRRLGQSQGGGSGIQGVTAGNFAAREPSNAFLAQDAGPSPPNMRLQQAMPAPDYGATSVPPGRSENWQADMRQQQAMPTPNYGVSSVPPGRSENWQADMRQQQAALPGRSENWQADMRQQQAAPMTKNPEDAAPSTTQQPSPFQTTLRDTQTAIQIGTSLASILQAASPGAPPPSPRVQSPMSPFQPTAGRFVAPSPIQQQQDLQRMRLQRAYGGGMR